MVESLKELNEICQKPQYKEVGNWMVRKILRPLALPITWLLLHTPVSANQVTLAGLLIGLWGIFFIALKGSGSFLIGTIFLQLWYLLDHVDGQIARYRKTASLTGRFYDFITHHLVHGALFFGLGFYAFQIFQRPFFLVWGFAASLAMIHFNLINDVRCKTFIEHLLKGKNWNVPSGEGISSETESCHSKGILRRTFSLLHKACEIHVAMNILTAAALLEAFLLKGADLRPLLFFFYGLAAPVIAITKISYLILTRQIDEDFRKNFGQ